MWRERLTHLSSFWAGIIQETRRHSTLSAGSTPDAFFKGRAHFLDEHTRTRLFSSSSSSMAVVLAAAGEDCLAARSRLPAAKMATRDRQDRPFHPAMKRNPNRTPPPPHSLEKPLAANEDGVSLKRTSKTWNLNEGKLEKPTLYSRNQRPRAREKNTGFFLARKHTRYWTGDSLYKAATPRRSIKIKSARDSPAPGSVPFLLFSFFSPYPAFFQTSAPK